VCARDRIKFQANTRKSRAHILENSYGRSACSHHDVVSGKHCVVKVSFRHRSNIDNDQTGHPRYYGVRSGDHITRDITTATMYLEPYIRRTGRVHISWQMQLEHRKWGRHVYVRVYVYMRACVQFRVFRAMRCKHAIFRRGAIWWIYALFTCAVTLSNSLYMRK